VLVDYVGKVVPLLSRRNHVSNSNENVGKVVLPLSRRKHVSNSNEYVGPDVLVAL
jgi:hypothetical protein